MRALAGSSDWLVCMDKIYLLYIFTKEEPSRDILTQGYSRPDCYPLFVHSCWQMPLFLSNAEEKQILCCVQLSVCEGHSTSTDKLFTWPQIQSGRAIKDNINSGLKVYRKGNWTEEMTGNNTCWKSRWTGEWSRMKDLKCICKKG